MEDIKSGKVTAKGRRRSRSRSRRKMRKWKGTAADD
jgi:hypothetical protein